MRILPFILFVCFCGLASVSLMRMQGGTATQSPWIGHNAPTIYAQPLDASTAHESVIQDKVTILNIFASWCGPCVAEHPLLTKLSRESGAELVGIAWNDSGAAIEGFLAEHGNPYARVYLDSASGSALALGIRGVPETFIIDREGVIRFHSAGPITDTVLERDMLPLLKVLAQ